MKYTVLFMYPIGSGADSVETYTSIVEVSEFVDPSERIGCAIRSALRDMGDANCRQEDSLRDLFQDYLLLAVFEGEQENRIPDNEDWLTEPEVLDDDDKDPAPPEAAGTQLT